MNIIKSLLAAVVATVTFSSAAGAAVVTFEGTNSFASNGLKSTELYPLQCSTYFTQDTGYCRGLASGDWTVFAYNTATVSKSAGGMFTFNGANLTAAWSDNMSIEVIGYRNNLEVYKQVKVVSDDVTTYFKFDYQNIDKVSFRPYGGTDAGTPGGGTLLAMDNFTFNEAVNVPEPGSIILLGVGLAGVLAARRRKSA